MSTVKLSFSELPLAKDISPNDYIVFESKSGAQKIAFENIVFGLENVTFADTLAQQSTSIALLSSQLETLSGDLLSEIDSIDALIGTVVQSTTGAFLDQIYPINSILFTVADQNPGLLIVSTTWERIAKGLFIAGVGAGTDKNGEDFIVGEADAPSNFNAGEYQHVLTIAEMPAHKHVFTPVQGENANVSGQYVESAFGESSKISEMTSTSTGGGWAHNNIPPMFGLYIWKRIS